MTQVISRNDDEISNNNLIETNDNLDNPMTQTMGGNNNNQGLASKRSKWKKTKQNTISKIDCDNSNPPENTLFSSPTKKIAASKQELEKAPDSLIENYSTANVPDTKKIMSQNEK